MGNCCLLVNNFIWRNEFELLQFQHCRPAPFVSSKFLMILRVFIAIELLSQSVVTIIYTKADSIKYFSEWTLYAATILFGLMAYIQVKTQKKIEDFALDIEPDRRNSWVQQDLEEAVLTTNKTESRSWKWVIFFYQMCFTFSFLASAVFWVFFGFDSTILENASKSQYYVLICMHTIPIGLMILEYPFNLIPFDFRMLPFNLLVLLVYLVDSVVFQLFEGKPVYKQMDWINNPLEASGVFFAICAGEIVIFSLVLALTKYVKLPKYEKMSDEYNMAKISGKLTLQGSREDNF